MSDGEIRVGLEKLPGNLERPAVVIDDFMVELVLVVEGTEAVHGDHGTSLLPFKPVCQFL